MKKNCILPSFLFVICILFSCQKSTVPYTQSGDWADVGLFPGPARSEAVSFVINNVPYMGTGWDGLLTRFNDLWKYDPTLNVWAQVASMPAGTGRSSAVGFSANGKGYVGTGYDGANYLNDFYAYDPVSNSWAQIAQFAGSQRYEAVAFGIGNYGYVGTGYDGANALKDIYRYDPALDLWTDVGFTGNKRYSAVTFVYNNKGYLVTGVNNAVLQADFWVFDPASDTSKWTQLRHINNYSSDNYDDGYTTIARYNGAAFVIDNYAYISTGQSGDITATTWLYDFAQDLWSEKTPFEGSSTTGAVGFSVTGIPGGGGFIATGRSANGQAAASEYVWQFFPYNTQNPNNN